MALVTCDGCGRTVGAEHMFERLRRLSLSDEFRPSYTNVLFLADAPSANLADYFYNASDGATVKSVSARAFFDSVMTAVGIARVDGMSKPNDERKLLTEFRRRGCQLAEIAECPIESAKPFRGREVDSPDEVEFAARYGNSVVRRIRFSYKPRRIVLLSGRTRGLIPILEDAGFGDRLLLHRGQPLDLPNPGDSISTMRFIFHLATLAAKADPALVA
jgi:hypothetical protein